LLDKYHTGGIGYIEVHCLPCHNEDKHLFLLCYTACKIYNLGYNIYNNSPIYNYLIYASYVVVLGYGALVAAQV